MLFGRRRRGILSPAGRGLIFGGVVIFWIAISALGVFKSDEHGAKLQQWNGRSLLSEVEMEKLDETDEKEVLKDIHEESIEEIDEKKEEKEKKKKTNETEECIPPAIKQFPKPLMKKQARLYGGIIIHILFAIYMFVGLAIMCDDYFVPALDKIADVLNLPPDVAGATFMAAGSSAPELATAVIGVFVAKDDIGISGVIGSAVFNITLVIAVCALAAEHVFYLNWWSVVRDCFSYLICIMILLCTIANEIVSWPEALLFLVLYVLYCVAMGFNSKIEEFVKSKTSVPDSWTKAAEQGGIENGANVSYSMDKTAAQNGPNGMMEMEEKTTLEPGTAEYTDRPAPEPKPEVEDPLKKPDTPNKLLIIKFYLMYPLYLLAKFTVPDCRKERFAQWYVATFLIAIAWISLYSYLMVWMITVIGFTFGIPDTVMGLTFIAAGVSVPDALSGIAVVKEGHGDMAVSNAIGSNVFDILVCLGVPWFLQTAIVEPGSYVRVRSRGLIYSTISLFSTIVFLIMASHFNGWKLDKKFGYILLVWYFFFMVFASMYELNVFGEFNPRECESDY